VTHLRQIMLEELERRNYAPSTIRAGWDVEREFISGVFISFFALCIHSLH